MSHTAGATILLAEDEPSIRMLIEAALSAEGYCVLEATNGYEALDVFNRHGADIDLVITDMCMPYIGGRELIAALQARSAALKCLGITAYSAEDAPGLPLLRKPFSRMELLRTVRDVLVQPARPALFASFG
jgi:two-component system cell cycle sensor histidine kinase/response regulator CckA